MTNEEGETATRSDQMAAPGAAPGRGRAGWLAWAAPPAAGLLVVGGVCFLPSSYAAAATLGPRSALAHAVARTAAYAAASATGTPEPTTHPPRDPFRPLVGAAAVEATNAATLLQPARPQPTSPPRSRPAPATSVPGLPGARSGSTGPASALPARPVSPGESRHRVLPGETLWKLAIAFSPSGSSIATLAARADGIYAANAAAIGSDPSHLSSGTALVIPATPYAG